MRFIEVNKHFWILEAIKLLRCLHSLFNEQLNFKQRLVQIKLSFFFPSKFTDPLKSGPQARNSWPKQRKWGEEDLQYMQLMSSHHSIGVYMLKSALRPRSVKNISMGSGTPLPTNTAATRSGMLYTMKPHDIMRAR